VTPSPGGLATALRSVAEQRQFIWVGWPGTHIPPSAQQSATALLGPHGKAVFLEAEEFQGFYENIANQLLWPLFHNISGRLSFDREAWQHYRAVNERFADAVLKVAGPEDTVWIHDYQLALLPQMLRDAGLDCAIGFFLHIPFPSHETYRTLPAREDLLRGMLGADLIGFHTYEFAQHFRHSCLRVLGLECEQDRISLSSHLAHLGVHPIGVDPAEIHGFTQLPEVQAELVDLERRFRGKKVILGVDRLDYTKGIPEKLLAFEEFLSRNPAWRTRVVLIQVASPSRTGVAEYQALKREVDELVGRINGKYGRLDHTPLVYINQTIARERLTALYQIADVAFITPLRDGMNLVALEYVTARGDSTGKLVLSEFAGAASCLAGAHLVNPHNISRMADVLAGVLAETETADLKFQQMREFVAGNTAAVWADRFLSRLAKVHESQRFGADRLRFAQALRGGSPADGALFLLDYAGTLQPHVPILSESPPDSRVRTLLSNLSQRATVYLMSGQPSSVLDAWFDRIPVGLVCEDGLAVREPHGQWPPTPELDPTVLDDIVRPVMTDFYEHTPGSRIERKRASLSWRYRLADPKLGPLRAKELYAQLEESLRGQRYTVLLTSRYVEVRHVAHTKTSVVKQLLARHEDVEFVFCAGNDRIDEDVFEVVLKSGRRWEYTCYVGGKDTVGQYYVESPAELLGQLEVLVRSWPEPSGAGAQTGSEATKEESSTVG
jgi:trehalose 6-phosphate synthase/phosphatase